MYIFLYINVCVCVIDIQRVLLKKEYNIQNSLTARNNNATVIKI